MRGIEHIFFDLDHTLWDYDRNSRETLLEIYEQFGLAESNMTERKFLKTFYQVNDQLWKKYNKKLVDREYIKTQRFKEIFSKLGIDGDQSNAASDYYISHCSKKTHLMPDALMALNYLFEKYELHIITNGFLHAQNEKLKNTGIAKYFKVVTTSECADARKPDSDIFEYSLNQAGATQSNSVMIGDNPLTDIYGARKHGLKTVFYDPSGKKRSLADYVIQSHEELIKLF